MERKSSLTSGPRFIPEGIQRKTRHAALRQGGCYFFTLYRWAQEMNALLGPRDYVSWFKRCVAAGHITETAFVNNAAAVMNMLVGWDIFRTVRHADATPNLPHFPVRVQNGSFPHFILQTGIGDQWDSLGGGTYPIVNYREII